MKAIKIKNTDLYFGSPMMVKNESGTLVPNYVNRYSLAGLINKEDKEERFSELPIKNENLELV